MKLLAQIFVVIVALNIPQAPKFGNIFPITNSGSVTPGLLTAADFGTPTCFRTPQTSFNGYSWGAPVTLYQTGTLHFLQLTNTGEVIEFTLPAGGASSCNIAVSSMNQSTVFQDWGAFPQVHTSLNGGGAENFPGSSNPQSQSPHAEGFYYDSVTGRVIMGYAGTYGTTPAGQNSLAIATLNTGTHTLTLNGCNRVKSTWGAVLTMNGIIDIPSDFVTNHLVAGQRWLAGFGGDTATIGAGVSFGPTAIAVNPPADNACPSATDTDIAGTVTTLAKYDVNTIGPSCFTSTAPPYNYGCNTSLLTVPTDPQPAQLAFDKAFSIMYAEHWDPYDTPKHSWDQGYNMPIGWYQDATPKNGIIVPYESSAGYLNTTITSGGTNGTATLASVDMNDGENIIPGQRLWLEYCNPATDPTGVGFCNSGNGDYFAAVLVNTVNVSTKVVTFSVVSAACPNGPVNCTQLPLTGGYAIAGSTYIQGTPTYSHGYIGLQIYDPSEYVLTLGGRNASHVKYTSEVDLRTMIKAFNLNTVYLPNEAGNGDNGPVNVITDPTDHYIMIVFKNYATGNGSDVIMMIPIAH